MVALLESSQQTLTDIIAEHLRPIVKKVDEEALFPKKYFSELGEAGMFYGLGANDALSLTDSAKLIEETAQTCMTTAFALWCHISAQLYIRNSGNEFLINNVLPELERGTRRGASGLSNPLKAQSDLVKLSLKAKRTEGGYIFSKGLPFVSNVGRDSWFAAIASTDDGKLVMAMIPADAENLTIRLRTDFVGLNGCDTCATIFRDVFVPDHWVISEDANSYIKSVRSQFLLYQIPLGLGVTKASIDLIEKSQNKQNGCNKLLPVQAIDLAQTHQLLRDATYAIAAQGDIQNRWDELLWLRLETVNLATRATHTEMVHHGGSGYLQHSDSFRRLRESYFLVNLTPTVKHLEKLLSTSMCS